MGVSLETSGVREILVVSTGNGILRGGVVRTLSSLTPHSVLVQAGTLFRSEDLPQDAIRMATKFHQERQVARIHQELCGGCGRCVGVCPRGAIATSDDGALFVDASKCTSCGKCVRACPRGALTLSVMTDAYCRVAASPFGRVVHADLAGDGRISEGLVFALRSEGRKQAKMVGADAIWIEASVDADSMLRVAATGVRSALVVVEDPSLDVRKSVELLERLHALGIRADLLVAGGDAPPELLELSRRSGARLLRGGACLDDLTEVHRELVAAMRPHALASSVGKERHP